MRFGADCRARELAAAKARPIEAAGVDEVQVAMAAELNTVLRRWTDAGYAYSLVPVDEAYIDREAKKLAELSATAEQKRADAAAAARGGGSAEANGRSGEADEEAGRSLTPIERPARLERAATQAEVEAGKAYDRRPLADLQCDRRAGDGSARTRPSESASSNRPRSTRPRRNRYRHPRQFAREGTAATAKGQRSDGQYGSSTSKTEKRHRQLRSR